MGEEKQGRRKGKKGRFRNSHFMDVAWDAYVRHLAIEKWRDMEGLRDAGELDDAGVLESAGEFSVRGAYEKYWREAWERHITSEPQALDTSLFAKIELAMREALDAEESHRIENGAPGIKDTAHYKYFIDDAMGQLLEEASGEIEDMD